MSAPHRLPMVVAGLLVLSLMGCGERSPQAEHPSTAASPAIASATIPPAAATAERGQATAEAVAPTPRIAIQPQHQPDHAVVVSQDESDADPHGQVRRQRLERRAGKYPLVRVEETVVRGAAGEEIRRRLAMVGDHLLVSAAPGHSAADIKAMAERLGMQVRRTLPGGTTFLVAFAAESHEALPAAKLQLTREAAVRVAEPDWIVHAIGEPNDALYPQLWGMHNTGQTGGLADADIDAPEAWEVGTGSHAIRVGVIDTGIDYNHPDLQANVWTNPGESGVDGAGNDKRTNGIDDDGNGYIDDWRGWDFVNNDNDPFDDHSHGTHCSGTIGGVGNDGNGVAGVCWQVSLIGLKFLSAGGSGAISDAVEAQLYANQMQFDLTSNSWGGGGYSQAMKDAIDAAGILDILFVAAAGNNAADNDVALNYPSSYDSPNIIAVAATDHVDGMAYFSSYGLTTVDLGAPGVNILSTVPGNSYASYNGTSMATPHVAGACALLKSVNPSLSSLQIKQALLETTDAVSALQGKTVTGGRLNIGRAMVQYSGPTLVAAAIVASDGPDADTVIEAGEPVAISVELVNTGIHPAIDVSGVLVSNDPLVTVEQSQVWYGTVAPGAPALPSPTFMQVQLSAAISTPHPVNLSLHLSGSEPDGDVRTWTIPVHFTVSTVSLVAGHVRRTTGGLPIGGAVVAYVGPTSGSVVADAAGAFAFDAIDGTYELVASADTFNPSQPVDVTTPPDNTQVELLLGNAQIAVSPGSIYVPIPQGLGTNTRLTIHSTGDATLNAQVSSPSIDTFLPSGFWHETAYRSRSGNASWYYGIESQRNYDNGAANSGSLTTTAPFLVTGAAQLSWWSWRQTEPGTTYDKSLVQVKPIGTSVWTTVAQITDTSGTWQEGSANLSAFLGQTVELRFHFDTVDSISNQYEGWYLDDMAFNNVPLGGWISIENGTHELAPGMSAYSTVHLNTAGFLPGTYSSAVTITSNDLSQPSITVPVVVNIQAVPVFTVDPAIASDDGPASDHDGILEPGETGTVRMRVRNIGFATGENVIAEYENNSPYITVLSSQATHGTLAPGADSLGTPIIVQVSPDCPPNHHATFTYIITMSNSGVVHAAGGYFAVLSRSTISGVVTDAVTGTGLAGATISVAVSPSPVSTQTAADGSYQLNGIPSGTWTVTAAKSGYTGVTTTRTFPPDGVWDVALGSPEIAVSPTELVQTLPVGGTITRNLTIDNSGTQPLSWSIAQMALGYTATTSDESGGPAFVWNDISTTGTPFTGLGDDNAVGPFAIGFSFPWYGGTMNQFYLCTNGYLSFTSPSVYLSITGLPTLNAPPDLVAFFLRDWNFNAGGSAHYQLVDAGTLIIQYTDVPAYGDSSNRITCQAVLKNDGTITFYYLSIGVPNIGTVGIQDGTRTIGTLVSQNQAIVHAQFAVRLTPQSGAISVAPTAGTIAPGSSAQVAVTIDANGLPPGTTSDQLLIQSNDPDEQVVEVPVITTVVLNQVPVANPQTLLTWMDQVVPVTLDGSDADGDPLTYQIVDAPAYGTLTGVPPTLTYHPANGATGSDTFTFTVSDGIAISEPATVTVNVQAYDLKVNFQPANVPTPPGYLQDHGRALGDGQDFGWNLSNVIHTRDRNSASSPDQRFDTLTHMQKPENPNAVWEIPVPNGTYEITVVCGDASNFDSVFRLQVEDVLAVSGTPTSANRWIASTPSLRVRVSDGRLTMRNGAGAVNNKVCFITALQVPTALFAARVNFQPATVSVPSGWVADTGAVYGDRNGLTYGWTSDNAANTRVRNSSASPSVMYDTFNHLQKPGNPNAVWEIAVPNGTYEVVVVSGDPGYLDSVFDLQVEGVTALTGVPTSANRWFTSAPGLRVTVSDGRLTVRNGPGASNNKINLIEIMQVPQSGG